MQFNKHSARMQISLRMACNYKSSKS